MTYNPAKPPRWSAPKVGDRVLHDDKLHEITHVWPIPTKGSATQKNVEVKIEGYGIGLKRVPPNREEDD